jgi:hypothetical protein
MKNSAILSRPESVGHTIRESLDAGKYYHVRVPGWASGGWDTHADSPAEAALQIGCAFKMRSFNDSNLGPTTEVLKHHRLSRIGCAYFEENCGTFPTLTHEHYDI